VFRLRPNRRVSSYWQQLSRPSDSPQRRRPLLLFLSSNLLEGLSSRNANRPRGGKIRGQVRSVGAYVSRRCPTRLWNALGGSERIADGMDHRELRPQDG
jgi:hypothetical protein